MIQMAEMFNIMLNRMEDMILIDDAVQFMAL